MALPVRLAAVATLAALVAAGGAVRAQDLEYPVKAAYLYNFLSFIEWRQTPGQSTDPFRVCIIGNDPF